MIWTQNHTEIRRWIYTNELTIAVTVLAIITEKLPVFLIKQYKLQNQRITREI